MNIRPIKFTFPCSVQKISDNEIVCELPITQGPMFNDDYINSIMRAMGTIKGGQFLEAAILDLERKLLIDSIR